MLKGPAFPVQTTSGDDRYGLAVVEPDAAAEEQHRRRPAEPLTAEEEGGGVGAEPAAELEDPLSLEEELAFFWKKEAEAGQVDLLLVHLDLREIGVVGEIGCQSLRDTILDVEPDIPVELVQHGRGRVQIGRDVGDHIGLDLQPCARCRHFQPDQGRGRRHLEHAGEAERRRNRRQERHLVLRGHAPLHVDAPERCRSRAVTQRLERNGHLDGPALLETAGSDIPHGVPVHVRRPLVGDGRIEQAAERVRHEVERVAPVVEGVQHDREGFVAEKPAGVALHLVRDDPIGVGAPAPRGHIQGVAVEHHPNFGLVGGGRALVRFLLDEIGDRLDVAIDAFVQLAIELERGVETGRAHRHPPLWITRSHLGWVRWRRAVNDRGRDGEAGACRGRHHPRFGGLRCCRCQGQRISGPRRVPLATWRQRGLGRPGHVSSKDLRQPTPQLILQCKQIRHHPIDPHGVEGAFGGDIDQLGRDPQAVVESLIRTTHEPSRTTPTASQARAEVRGDCLRDARANPRVVLGAGQVGEHLDGDLPLGRTPRLCDRPDWQRERHCRTHAHCRDCCWSSSQDCSLRGEHRRQGQT